MEKFFCETKRIIAMLLLVFMISIVIAPSSQAANLKDCLKFMKDGYGCTYTGLAIATFKTKTAAKKGYIFKIDKFVRRGEVLKIEEVDGNIIRIPGEKGPRYIKVTESNAKNFSFHSKIVRANGLTIENLKNGQLTLKEGESKQLEFTIKPNNVTMKGVSWKSSNTSIAKIDDKGKITAKKAGTVKITGKIDGVEKSFNLKVISYKYNAKGNTYTLAVEPSVLDETLNAIKTKKVYQNNGWKGRGEEAYKDNTCTDYKCYRIALCHLDMLLNSNVRNNIKHTGVEAGGSYSNYYQKMGSEYYYWTGYTPNIVKESIDARNTSNSTYLF